VLNKIDLMPPETSANEAFISVSARQRTHLDLLMERSIERLGLRNVVLNEPFLFTERQRKLIGSLAEQTHSTTCIDILRSLG